MIRLNEAKDLELFKRLVNLFAEFIEQQPATGMTPLYKSILDAGLKSIPKDKKALEILDNVLSKNAPKSVQEVVNTSFTELPLNLRPMYKKGNSKLTAFWNKDGKIHNKVFDLLMLNGTKKAFWSDELGNQIDLLTIETV